MDNTTIEKITNLEKQLAGIQAELADLKKQEFQDDRFGKVLGYAVLFCAKHNIPDYDLSEYTIAVLPYLNDETLKILRSHIIEYGITESNRLKNKTAYSMWVNLFGEFQAEFLRRGLM